MKKSNKVLMIVLIALLFCLGVTYIVFYCINPTQTQDIATKVIDYICNKPLPVVGVSTLVLAIATYKIVVFIVKHKNSKVGELIEEVKQLKEDLSKSKEEAEQLIKLGSDKYKEQCDHIKEICDNIPNKKVKELGVKFYGKEIDNKTETKEI